MNQNPTKTEVQYELCKLILLNLMAEGVISRGDYLLLRDKLIDELQPVVGELERGLPWLIAPEKSATKYGGYNRIF